MKIIAIGKIKEKYLREGIAEYMKRLRKIEIIEIREEKIIKDENKVKKIEGEKILKKIKDDFVVVLDMQGKKVNSVEFSNIIKKNSNITFIIGGPLGLHENVLKRADMKISFSELTFTHQMIRMFLLEQIYRADTIIKGKRYHK